jgi:BMFP domain-containing protein YqiC
VTKPYENDIEDRLDDCREELCTTQGKLADAEARVAELEAALAEATKRNPVWDELDALAHDVLDLEKRVADSVRDEQEKKT